MRTRWNIGLACLVVSGTVQAAPPDGRDRIKTAEAFGARPWVEDVSLSPDGRRLAFVAPSAARGSAAMVEDLSTGVTKAVAYSDGNPLRIASCGWASSDRIACYLSGVASVDGRPHDFSRVVAVNADGTGLLGMEKTGSARLFGLWASDGSILDWLSGADGKILMARRHSDGSLRIERVDTRTGDGEVIKSLPDGGGYYTDGYGNVRIFAKFEGDRFVYRYRTKSGSDWQLLGQYDPVSDAGLRIVTVDGEKDLAYALQKLNGRDALYSFSLSGTPKSELIYADPQVDVAGAETIGRHNRTIGYYYVTDRTQTVYLDTRYRALAASLSKALPNREISFQAASADEKRLLVMASSDVDPGHYYLFDTVTRQLTEALMARPQLEGMRLAEQRGISFRGSDGTMIPAYLTLPAGSGGHGLPAIVMPHGGPWTRDVWGFDWLAQYFAARGYAVLQPQFRGSTGYGDAFENGNAIKSWRTAISDVVDSGHWLIKEGIADPAKLAIFGWSYGGYAALQANVIAPDLFRATVAVAPVTDLQAIRTLNKSRLAGAMFDKVTVKFADAVAGSPVRHAADFKAPVLLFHGDRDTNVDITDSRRMDAALRAAGKQSRLITYPMLDHQLRDSATRTDLLTQTDEFLTKALALPAR
ncbi:alpha/beta hydrolase family protein [Sphingomonas crusticola]|uniref:alpha/beta hydrolase family protein n=1 Tax=Sphingomonas crusticola TaxID=1697973 RepID=UPI000E2817E0|nr:alpha/beta fold hydrolase [Sphingomonas crusticola]